jgi:death on curing protein
VKREPEWVEKHDVLAIHDILLVRFGGLAGIRDEASLESALDSPRNRFHHGETDPFMLAAACAQAISRNHPFVDGNKRVALACAAVFLMLNGYHVTLPEAEAVKMTFRLVATEITENEFAASLKVNAKRLRR